MSKKYDKELDDLDKKIENLREKEHHLKNENQEEIYRNSKDVIQKFISLTDVNRTLIFDIIE